MRSLSYFLLMCALGPLTAIAASRFVERQTLTLPNGPALEVHVRRPQKSAPNKSPAVLLFGGFESGAQAIQLFDPKEQILLATFQYPFAPPHSMRVPRDLYLIPKAKQAIHDTLRGIHALVDWASTQPEVDASKIVLVGASFGSPLVSIVTGDNAQVQGLILAHGFGDIGGTIARQLEVEWRKSLGVLAPPLAWLVGRLAWWYMAIPAPEERLSQLQKHQSALLLSAAADDLIPKKSVQTLREALGKSQSTWEEQSIEGSHLRPNETALINDLLQRSIAWMKKRNLL